MVKILSGESRQANRFTVVFFIVLGMLLPISLPLVHDTDGFGTALFAESVPSAEITFNTAFLADSNGLSLYPGGATGGITLKLNSARADAIKGNIQLSADSDANLALDRAYLKARFPWFVQDTSFRLTGGKAPLSWGKGFVFNAGDPVFGALPSTSLTGTDSSDYRTAADWMTVATLPVGGFSFAELVYLPPVDAVAKENAGDETAEVHNRAGGRLFVTPGLGLLQSIEAGYLFAEGPVNTIYIALDGSLFFDYYASACSYVSSVNAKWQADYATSFGIFRMIDVPNVPLSIRAEGLIYPEYNRQLWYQSVQAGISDSLQLTVYGLFATGIDDTADLVTIQAFSTPYNSKPSALALLPGSAGVAAVSLSWTPLKGCTFSGAVLKQFSGDDSMGEGVILSAGCKYAF